jgi:hypothetical protein
LRRIVSNESIHDHIKQFLEIIGIPDVNDKLLKTLLGSGKIILFLDGFDEVSEKDKQRIINEIESIALKYDELQMIITSRPESGIEVSPLLEVVRLSDLRNGEFKAVIRKLSEDNDFADNLIKQVETHKSTLSDLLCTPLLVTLLVMTYKSFQELPKQLSDFYDSIFQVLLQRHDGVKPGFKRPRRCEFNDNQYRTIFENLCFESRKKIKSIFTYDDISLFAKTALEKNRLNVDENKYIEDIVKVTCLILHEGGDYRFIHKSVQEYYASAFVKHRSEPVAVKFYSQMIKQGPYGPWQQELYFLSEIDKYRYNKYFYLPYHCLILNCTPDNIPTTIPKVNISMTKAILGSMQIGLNFNKFPELTFFTYKQQISSRHIDNIIRFNYTPIINAFKAGKIKTTIINDNPLINSAKNIIISVEEILNVGLMESDFFPIAQEVINESFVEINKALEIISKEESFDLDLNVDI